MTVAMTDGVMRLYDVCTVEDAEAIANILQEGVTAVDLTGCRHLHTAAFQLLLAARLPVSGLPDDPALIRWVLPLLGASASAASNIDTRPQNSLPSKD